MSDYVFLEYQAKLSNTGHTENEGEFVHCIIKMKKADRDGKRLLDVDLHRQAEDNILSVMNPGPRRAIGHSGIWNVTEEEFHKLEKVSDYHRVGDCEIYFDNADDRSSSPVFGDRHHRQRPRERFSENDPRARGKIQSWHAFKTP